MENELSFVVILPLKKMAMRRVAINLWVQPDTLASIEDFGPAYQEDNGYFSKEWCQTIDSEVRNKMAKLVLPNSLKKQILPIVTPIGLQILRWKGFYERHLAMPGWEGVLQKYLVNSSVDVNAPILTKLCWKTSGTVDYCKTAEELIRCEMVDIVKRFQLACLCCLDEYIPVLWEELPEEIKGKFYNEEDISQVKKLNLQFCWPYILKGEQSKLDCITAKYCRNKTFHQQAFDYSAGTGNKAATEYFFRKLTQEEKADSFISGVVVGIFRVIEIVGFSQMYPSENLFDIVCYLLSKINHEEHMEIFKCHDTCLLLCFMDWPCQDLFLKNADLLWDVIPAGHYDFLLQQMSDYCRYSNYHYPKFFQEFFEHSPINFRKMFVDQKRVNGYFLRVFLHNQDKETVKVIFSNVDAADRLRLVSSKPILDRFYKCILKGRRHKVKVFLREATLSKEDTEILKETFLGFLKRYYRERIQENKRVWMRFLQILDQIFASAQRKRCLEDKTLNKAKRFCSD